MTDTEGWLTKYGDNQSRTANLVLHWIAVPLVILGTVGVLWALPVPGAFRNISPLLNWGVTFLMATQVYYFIISIALAIGMLPVLLATAALVAMSHADANSPLWASTALLAVGIAGLYFGRGSAGDVRGLARNIQLIMIAPLWVLSRVYRRLHIPY